MQKELKETRLLLLNVQEEKANEINILTNKISQVTSEFEIAKEYFNKEIGEYKQKVQAGVTECTSQNEELASLRTELQQTKLLVEEKDKQLEDLASEKSEIEGRFTRDVEKLQMDYSAKALDAETSAETIQQKDNEISELRKEIESVKGNLDCKNTNLSKLQQDFVQKENILKNEIETLKASLLEKITEIDEVKQHYDELVAQREQESEEVNGVVKLNNDEIQKLRSEITQLKEKHEQESNEQHTIHKRNVEENEIQIRQLSSEIKEKTEYLQQNSLRVVTLQEEVNSRVTQIETLTLELESGKRRLEAELSIQEKNKQEMSELKLSVGDLQRKLQAADQKIIEMAEQKYQLEGQIQTLMSSSGDNSAKLEHLNRELREKESTIESVKEEYSIKLQEEERKYHEMELKLQSISQETEKAILVYEEKVKLLQETEQILKNRCELATTEAAKIREELTIKVSELTEALMEKEVALKKALESSTVIERTSNNELERIKAELQISTTSYQSKIEMLNKEIETVKQSLVQKSEDLIAVDTKHKQFVVEVEQKEKFSKVTLDEKTKKIQEQLEDREKQIKQLLAELEEVKEECNKNGVNNSQKDVQIIQLNKELITLREEVEKMSLEKSEVRKLYEEATTQVATYTQETIQNSNALSKKQEEILEMESKYQEYVVSTQQKEIEMKANHDEQLKTVQMQLNEKMIETQNLIAEVLLLREDCSKNQLDFVEKDRTLNNIRTELEETKKQLIIMQAEREELLYKYQESSTQLSSNTAEVNNLFSQIAQLTEKAEVASKLSMQLQIEKNNYVQLMQKLQITNKQKEHVLTILEDTVQKHSADEKCKHLLELARNLEVNGTDEQAIKISELQTALENTNILLTQRDNEIKKQREEFLSIQRDLLQVYI